MYTRNSTGGMVPLGSLMDIQRTNGPDTVSHYNVHPAALRGAGAEMNQALGTAVFAGMIGVTLFGIFLTPVFFSVITKIFGRTLRKNEPEPTGHPVTEDEPVQEEELVH